MKKTKIISMLLSMTMLLTAIVPGTFAGEDTSGANVSEPIVVEEKETALDRIKSGINSFRDIVDAIGNTFDDIGDFVTSFGNAASTNSGSSDEQEPPVCEFCGVVMSENPVHTPDCLTHCTCTPVDGVHQTGCVFEPTCETCEQVLSACTCCDECGAGADAEHENTCSKYVDLLANQTVKVGDKIWIKSGAMVYKSASTTGGLLHSHKLWLNHEVIVEEITTDEAGVQTWYKISYIDNVGLWANYRYVQVQNTSVNEPAVESNTTVTTEDGLTVSVDVVGLPENARLVVNPITDEAKMEVFKSISSIKYLSEDEILFTKSFDIKLFDGNTEWQPANGQSVMVTISGDIFLTKFMMLSHILDTQSAVQNAINNNSAFAFTKEGLSALYPRETTAVHAITGLDDTIYAVELSNESSEILYNPDDSITFALDSFSEMQLIGYTVNNEGDMPENDQDTGSKDIHVDKFVTWDETNPDKFKLTLEAYATGKRETKATDVVFIIDQSCSMYSAVDPTAAFGGASAESSKMTVETLKNIDMSKEENKKAAIEGYYVAVFHYEGNTYYTIPIRYDWDSKKWQRTTGDGSRSVNMWVSETIVEVWNNEWQELDNVYTDNKEFTIYKSVYGAAYDAMETFADRMKGDDGEGTPKCRAAIVGFSCPKENYGSGGPMNTGIYINGVQKFGVDFETEIYNQAFHDMSTPGGIAQFRNSINAIRTSGQTTTTDAGFEITKKLLNVASSEETEKVVILFTDGKPENQISTTPADYHLAAIARSNEVKSIKNTTVYTFGISLGSAVVNFLKALSSSYPKAEGYISENDLGEYYAPECWGMASNSAEIRNAFDKIAQQIVSSMANLNENTVLKDIIASDFKLPDGADKDDIVVKTDKWTGKEFAGKPVVKEDLTVKVQDDIISVSGFEYDKEFVTEGLIGGSKLIVEIPIIVNPDSLGGNGLPTNEKNSGLYDGDTILKQFVSPTVDVLTHITVTKTVIGKGYDNIFQFTNEYKDFDYYDPKNTLAKILTAKTKSVTDNKTINANNEDQYSIKDLKVGTSFTLTETLDKRYEMSVVVKNASGNIVNENDGYTNDGYTFDKTTNTLKINSITPGMTIEVINKALYADLVIKKVGIDPLDHHDGTATDGAEAQSTIFTVSGGGMTMDVIVCGNGSAKIVDLPLGQYSVAEKTDWSWRYDLKSVTAVKNSNSTVDTNKSITFELTTEGETVTFTNDREREYWLSGDCYCENQWTAQNQIDRSFEYKDPTQIAS